MINFLHMTEVLVSPLDYLMYRHKVLAGELRKYEHNLLTPVAAVQTLKISSFTPKSFQSEGYDFDT